MGTKKNPGKFDCYANAEDDEPMFTFLARDPDAPYVIREWAKIRYARLSESGKRIISKEEQDQLNQAIDCAEEMERWRKQNR